MNGPFTNALGFIMSRNKEGALIAQDNLGKVYTKSEYYDYIISLLAKIIELEKRYNDEKKTVTFKEYVKLHGDLVITNKSILREELICLKYADDDELFWEDLGSGRL